MAITRKEFEQELNKMWDKMMLPEDDDIRERVIGHLMEGIEEEDLKKLTKE